jgi:flap endonuclease-1
MGIKNLNKFLRDKCPSAFISIHLSSWAYKKVAIDISLYLHKFKAVCGDGWLTAFINLIISLRRNEIHCVFIFDGPAPPEKDLERTRRKDERNEREQSITILEDALQEYHMTGVVDQILITLWTKRREDIPPRFLGEIKKDKIDMKWVQDKIKQKRAQIIDISPNDLIAVKNLFDIMEVPYNTATAEAEKLCAKLCRYKLVDAVLSEDTDLIAYQTPCFLTKIDTRSDTCIMINYSTVLDQLKLTPEQMIDFCIMCGTDYNNNIFKVGPMKAYKYINDYGSIEGVKDNTKLDITILNHVRGRELFTVWDVDNINYIPYCGRPNLEKLKIFVQQYNVNIKLDNIEKIFETEIIIEE